MTFTAHPGLVTAARATVLDHLSDIGFDSSTLLEMDYPSTVGVPWALGGAWVPTEGRFAHVPTYDTYVTHSVLEWPIRAGNADVYLTECLLAQTLEGVGMSVSGCHIGSVDLPDGRHRRPFADGVHACRAGGQRLPEGRTPIRSVLRDSDIINTDGRWGSAHMDGVQIWDTGHVTLEGLKIDGWWQSAIMLKSDLGPVDDVMITGCELGGARYFQLRIIDGGKGRPTNVSVIGNVLRPGTGRHPVNSGNDMCTLASQTKYVRTEEERLDASWIVYRDNCLPDGTEVEPLGGWFQP